MFSAKLSAFHYLLLQQPCIYCEKVTQKLMNLVLIQAALLRWDRNFHETLQGSSCKVSWICSKKRIVSKSWSKSVSFSQALLSFLQKHGAWALNGITSKGNRQQCFEPVTELLWPCITQNNHTPFQDLILLQDSLSYLEAPLIQKCGVFYKLIILENWIHDPSK